MQLAILPTPNSFPNSGKYGPYLPLKDVSGAALQLSLCGHSWIVQHSSGQNAGHRDAATFAAIENALT